MVIGHNLKGMGVKDLNVSDFSQALNDVVTGQTCKLTDQEAQQLVNNFIQKQQEEATRAIREEGERFLAENAKKEGVTVLPSGLQYTVITEGTGAQPLATDRVKWRTRCVPPQRRYPWLDRRRTTHEGRC